MKAVFKHLLMIVISAAAVSDSPAQTFSTLRAFTLRSGEAYTNSDGYNPVAALYSSDNVLYGTTLEGGSANSGSVFRIRNDGTGFTNLHSFSALEYPVGTNGDGTRVSTDLVLSGGYLYGIASFGGDFGGGTLLRLKTDGSGFTNLYHFGTPSTTNSAPGSAIVLSGNSLYGATPTGGDFGAGMLFRINLDGSGFTNLHSFSPPSSFQGLRTNADGIYPQDGVTLSGNALYGAASKGGPLGFGTVFRITTNGTEFSVLHAFSGWYDGDGDGPHGLLLSGNTLYGTTTAGGEFGNGTLFALGTGGNGFTNLHVFTSNFNNSFTNEDGASPNARLILVTDTLYGTTFHAGPSGNGTVFSMSTNGNGFTTVHT
ncbi:MAG: choice-of-anchor tandem repeat GloVer-containing protein, partial [Limisphaerales bacterium]